MQAKSNLEKKTDQLSALACFLIVGHLPQMADKVQVEILDLVSDLADEVAALAHVVCETEGEKA